MSHVILLNKSMQRAMLGERQVEQQIALNCKIRHLSRQRFRNGVPPCAMLSCQHTLCEYNSKLEPMEILSH
jgi:hypothetical protein